MMTDINEDIELQVNSEEIEAEMIDNSNELVMSEAEAKNITNSIRTTATAVCLLLKKAHDEKAWKTLGYKSWKEYIEEEFDFSRARSYQLLEQGNIIEAVSKVSDSKLYLTEKEAKTIKDELPKITEKISEATKNVDESSEREKIAKEIIDEEIKHKMYNDKDTYDESKDIDKMIDEDSNNEDSYYSGSSSNNNSFSEREPSEVISTTTDNKEAHFYLENLSRTLSIMETFPVAKDLAKVVDSDEQERIILRNRIKYAIKWLSSLENELK